MSGAIKYANILNYVRSTPWAIHTPKMCDIVEFITDKAASIEISEEELQSRIGVPKPGPKSKGAIAILNMFGVVAKRIDETDVSSPGGFSVERFTNNLREVVNNPDVKAVVINIDSPGGSVLGVQELANEIFEARSKKHIVAVANDMAASAAYHLASAASEFVVTPSGMVGSIGVFTVHQDISKALEEKGIKTTFISAGKFKVEGNSFEPLTEEAISALQESVDFYYDGFVKDVAKFRGVSVSNVRNGFGEGRVVDSKKALAEGMVDRIDTLDGVLSKLGFDSSTPSSMNAESDDLDFIAYQKERIELEELACRHG